MTRGLPASKPACGGSRQLKNRRAALVLVAVEKRGQASGRVRMNVIPDFKASTIIPVLTRNVAPGSTIHTDGLKSFGLAASKPACGGAGNLRIDGQLSFWWPWKSVVKPPVEFA